MLAVIRGVVVLTDALGEERLTLVRIEEAGDGGHVDVVFLVEARLQLITGPAGEIREVVRHRVGDHLGAAEGQQGVGAHEACTHGSGGLGGQTLLDEGGGAVANTGLHGIDGGGPLGDGLSREAAQQDAAAGQRERCLTHGTGVQRTTLPV